MDLKPEDAIDAAVRAGLLDVHTSMPARIVSYNDQTQRAVVRPCAKRALPSDDGGVALETIPDIQNVLVSWPGGGGFILRFPLAEGDSGWLVFSETDSSGWEETGDVSDPNSTERHGLGSPIFYPLARAAVGGTGNLVGPQPFVIGPAEGADFVALKSAVDALQQNLDSQASFGTPWGPTVPGNLAPAGPQTSSTVLKA